MFEKEREQYSLVLEQYRKLVVDKMADWKEYTEILFSAHSCAIEGNTFSVDDTRALKEQGLGMIPVGKTLFEAFEILDHFRAYEFLMQRVQEPMSEQLIKETHRILTEHTISYKYADAVPGEYTNTDMGAGDTLFGDHEVNISRMPNLVEATQAAIEKEELHPIEIAAQFHRHFIFLHPFRDGNGRLGRLLSNFILDKFQYPIVIIEKEDKPDYLDALRACRDQRNTAPMVQYFFSTAIKRMEKEIAQKKNNEMEMDF